MWATQSDAGTSQGLVPGRTFIGPLLLILLPPYLTMTLWYGMTQHSDFTLRGIVEFVREQGDPLSLMKTICPPWPDVWAARKIIVPFMLFELLLMRIVPGPSFKGPAAASGHVPVYKANGVGCYLLSILAYLWAVRFDLYKPGTTVDNFGAILAFLTLFAAVLCWLLYFKGRIAPSGLDSGTSGSVIVDYYWGRELYPRILGWDVKVFTNCRFGMMGWAILVIDCVAKQAYAGDVKLALLVSASLQLVYITKFFIWETGYFTSIDIMHDRAGWMLCWGCLVYVPAVYTSQAMFLTVHSPDLTTSTALGIFLVGLFCILANYDCDRQRQQFRIDQGKVPISTLGIWNTEPKCLTATYTTEDGRTKSTLLLCNGWWGVSRHFNYVLELGLAFCWTAPALWTSALPYYYLAFLTVLLFDRAIRDDKRCLAKYGDTWIEYCKRVPSAVVPHVF